MRNGTTAAAAVSGTEPAGTNAPHRPDCTAHNTDEAIMISETICTRLQSQTSGFGRCWPALRCRSGYVGVLCLALLTLPVIAQPRKTPSSARAAYQIDRRGVVERSDVILQKPNESPQAAMPLGNGRLGVAVWAQDGFTAQLNRADTLPERLSPGQVILPGLKAMTRTPDYSGRLDLYNGEFRQSGGGITATTYVAATLDVMVVRVTGMNPKTLQTAQLQLWPPRQPNAVRAPRVGILAETWLDNKEAGASGRRFGSLAAVTADARDIQVERSGPRSVTISFLPHPDGSFRVLVAAPSWHGGDAAGSAARLLMAAKALSPDEHRTSWHRFWENTALMKLHSADGAAEYFENLRIIDLFTAAAESRDQFPGSQAGIGDLFSSVRDEHKWGPPDYWHWNLRMQVSANLGAGAFSLNQPYFRLYRENLQNVLAWTRQHMGGRPGACVPETMRFNGRGYENESWLPGAPINCGEDTHPYYNARTISTGAEVSLWIWRQFEYTDDLQFLRTNYPLMRESARFLLAYATHNQSGLHTFPSNAHETEWDVHDPTTDISAMRTLFPAVIRASKLLGTDQHLAEELAKELGRIQSFPVVGLASPGVLVDGGVDRDDTIIIPSHDPGAAIHNSENVGLEPVWPYGLIGDAGPLHALGVRTFLHRPNKNQNDWSADPEQAVRLGLADQFKASALALTERYQTYPSGLASFAGPEFYVEQVGVLADALQQALVQDYDGLIRIAPAWPKDWDAIATVYVQHGGKVHVQLSQGEISSVSLEAGHAAKVRIRNPWPGDRTEVINARAGSVVVPPSSQDELRFAAEANSVYFIQRAAHAGHCCGFPTTSGMPATAPKTLGSRSIGIPR
jgi:alpha-L-fucosidase 2